MTTGLRIDIYDTTLRDGTQRHGISLSVEDKGKIARKLDELGIQFIEGGWPGSNPKDAEFFLRAPSLGLKQATVVAFGSTRRANHAADSDANLRALVDARTSAVTLVGKTWDLHVTRVLETSLEENLRMIADSVSYLRSKGLTVFYDAEHFFDGFKANPEYALQTLQAAREAGAQCLVMCDTNGGTLPIEIGMIVEKVRNTVKGDLGIHAHNDAELAVANTLSAVARGVTHVQGTINGYGERCGNANLCSIIPNLQLKMDIAVLGPDKLAKLTEVSHFVSEIANLSPDAHQPYVGLNAFAHKGGLHVAAVMKVEESYQHLAPELVGNRSRVVVSELSGRGNIIYKAEELGLNKSMPAEQATAVLKTIKSLESRGFQFESAEASLDLLIRRTTPGYQVPFELIDFMVVIEKHRRHSNNGEETLAEAMVKVRVGDEIMHTAAEGNGPVNALDQALRKALLQFYPSLAAVRLVDYKVRILDETAGTDSQVRVLIQSSDGEREWSTVGSSPNILEASWYALADSFEYWLVKRLAETQTGEVPTGAK
ncbi:MAG: citramalate synthase [Chloroflexota bacterium]|nr:MAG: citramalate synthase [Chloroflexota bacterium]